MDSAHASKWPCLAGKHQRQRQAEHGRGSGRSSVPRRQTAHTTRAGACACAAALPWRHQLQTRRGVSNAQGRAGANKRTTRRRKQAATLGTTLSACARACRLSTHLRERRVCQACRHVAHGAAETAAAFVPTYEMPGHHQRIVSARQRTRPRGRGAQQDKPMCRSAFVCRNAGPRRRARLYDTNLTRVVPHTRARYTSRVACGLSERARERR